MSPAAAYKQNANVGWTRIDLLLALFDGAIEQTERALASLQQREAATAPDLLLRARLIVLGLASNVDPSTGGETAYNLMRLCEFVAYCLEVGTLDKLTAAVRVLRSLREGFQGIHAQAVQLERSGVIPPADRLHVCQTMA